MNLLLEIVPINLKNIKGIFGNENGLLAAVQNEKLGLDIIRIK